MIVIGRIGAPYGLQGWLKVHSFTESQQDITNYFPWLLHINGQWQAADIVGHQFHCRKVIIHIADCHNRTDARKLCHCDIGVYREQLPPLAAGNYYWTDLEAMTVINQHNITLGVVDRMLATGDIDVMVVKGDKEYLIPFKIGEFVTEVDPVHQQIRVNWDVEL